MAKQKKTKKNFNLKYVDYFKLNTYTSKRLEVELENSRWSKVRESDANKLKKLEIAATESENSKDEVKINLAYTNLHNLSLKLTIKPASIRTSSASSMLKSWIS